MTLQERFAPEALIAAACEQAGNDDFGEDGWQSGLELLTDGLVNEARLSVIGTEVAYLDLIRGSGRDGLPVPIPGDRARAERARAIEAGFGVTEDVWSAVTALAGDMAVGRIGTEQRA